MRKRIAQKGEMPMAAGKLLSTREVARITDLPESTVRWYQRQFDGFLPVTRDGRGVWWPPEALPILRTIRESFAAGLAREDVGHVLASVRPEPTPAETRARKMVVQSVVDRARALEALREDVAQIRQEVHALPHPEATLTAIVERLARMESSMTRLHGELSKLTEQVAALADAQAFAATKPNHFWNRE